MLGTQSTGQGKSLHDRVSISVGQATPPCNTSRTILRTRVCSPTSAMLPATPFWTYARHETEHAAQEPHADTSQSTGHRCLLHSRCSCRYGQAYPPLRACVTTLRERDCEPPVPHDFVHVVHAPNAETTQCTAHGWTLQERDSARYGHTYPPWRACAMMLRERDCVPPLHDRVHESHALKGDVTQCSGQGPWLQEVVSARWSHAAPPNALKAPVAIGHADAPVCCRRARVRDLVPAPHVVEHEVHVPQSFTMQSIGQQWALHALLSARAGHA